MTMAADPGTRPTAAADDEPPPPAPVTDLRGRPMTLPRYWPPTAIGVLAALLAWYRVPDGQRNTLYAEDGVLFLPQWVIGGHFSLLWEPYAGYQHLIPRFVSWGVTTFLPVPWWGIAVTAISCGIVGVVAALIFVCSADVMAYLPARVVAALITVLIPIAAVEPLGNLANLHWFLLYLTPWLLLAVPRSWTGLWLIAGAMLLATMTEPQCLVFAPLALWRFVTFPRSRVIVIAYGLGMLAQTITYLTAPRDSVPGRPPWLSLAQGYVLDVGMSITTSRADLLGSTILRVGWWVGFLWVLLICALAVVGFVLGRTPARLMLASLLLGSVASWSLSYVLNNVPAYYFSLMGPDQLANPPLIRWGTAASMMLAATIPVAVAVLVQRFPRWWPAALTVLSLLMLLMIVNLAHHPSVPGSPWSDQLDAAETACAADPNATVIVTVQPSTWQVGLPCFVIDG
jgi:hypothetical protein